jgi:signal transduction histidine kinase
MPLTLIDRFHAHLRLEQQAAIDAGQLRKRDELELLEPQQLRPLLLVSIVMLVIGTVFFVALNIAAYIAQTHITQGRIGGWELLLWIGINVLAYIVVMFLHEGIHALAFLFWGGKPYFGAKLPVALYCGAKNQLFRRNQYLVVGLAPLVVISLAAIIFTLLFPVLASYTLFASIGNFSGAAGDVWSVLKILRHPAGVLVEDTASGYRVWEITVNVDVPSRSPDGL